MQTTAGNVTLNADTVVANPTSGAPGTADVHLLANVLLGNATRASDILEKLGQGGNVTATQTSTGWAFLNANYVSSTDTATGAASDRQLLADGGTAASTLRIGINAVSNSTSDSDLSAVNTPRPADSNRGGVITVAQTAGPDTTSGNTKTFSLNLDINGTGHVSDLKIVAQGEAPITT